jgi:predicted Zn-dependent protease
LPAQGASYRFTLVENDLGGSTHEPLALPGGAIFVPANLIFDSRSEAEFAGMLAHAMAHVAARHGTRLATRAQASNLEFSPVMYSNLGARPDADAHLRDLQRSFEMEADQMTVGMLAGAGYDPEAFAAYIARQQKDEEGTWSPLLSRDERVARIRTAIQQLPQSDFQRMQDELHRLTTRRP